MHRANHRVHSRRRMHHQQPIRRTGRQQQPVTRRQPAPLPHRRRQPQMTLTGHREHALPIRAEHHQTGTLMDVQPGARHPTERTNDPTVGDPTTGIQSRHPIDQGADTRSRKIRKRQRPTTKTPARTTTRLTPARQHDRRDNGSDHNVRHADHPRPKRDRPTSTRRSDWCGQARSTTSTSKTAGMLPNCVRGGT